MPAFLSILPALIAAAGTIATTVAGSVQSNNQIKSQEKIADQQRKQQMDLARKQALEQARQRLEGERQANSSMFQEGMLNQSRNQQMGAQGRVAARQGALGTIQQALA
jgi:hypothetical protein